MTKKRVVFVFIITLSVLLLANFFGTKKTTLTIKIDGEKPTKAFFVRVGEETHVGTGGEITFNTKPADTTITVSSQDYQEFAARVNIKEGINNAVAIKLSKTDEGQKIMLSEDANSKDFNDYVINKYKTFSNNTWVAGSLYSKNSSESEILVKKKVNGKWVGIIGGTAIDSNELAKLGAPKELIDYIKEL
jgi:hypothetical protein